MSTKNSVLSKWSWLIIIFYVLLSLFTYVSIAFIEDFRNLFNSTEFFMQFNLVWFGIIISIYGLWALYQNYNRTKRLGRTTSLDTQFLIVMCFIFLTLVVSLDFITYVFETTLPDTQLFAIESTSKTIFYGAFVCGLLSIIMPKFRDWWTSRT